MPSTVPSRSQHDSKGDKGSAKKRRPVRRDPEKRRQQNIQAQKKYREKVKKRLDHLDQLETLAAAVSEIPAPEPPQSGPSDCTSSEHDSPLRRVGQSFSDHSVEFSVGCSELPLPTFIPQASLSDVSLWDPAGSVVPPQPVQITDAVAAPQCWVSYVDCGCLRPHVQVSSSRPKKYRDLQVLNVGPTLLLADPYVNALRVERICIVQAVLSNCLHIGITETMFCSDDAISPFFRPGGETADGSGSDGLVRTIQSIFKTLKKDMRPTSEQITIAHRPVIDVLPFPTLRTNLIKSGDAVDEDELYDDLLNGLVCWGGAGLGKRDRDCSSGYVSTGTPWDCRSWEGRTWFLQKYWALLGGEDGELVRQSEWWRNMRGEEDDTWLGLSVSAC